MTDRSIVEAAARLRRHGEPYLVATVVSATGCVYRRPGARMILTRFRWVAGSVSGGALEGDLSNRAWWRTRDGQPLLLRYGADGGEAQPEDDDIRSAFGLGCDGEVEVLLERVGQPGRIDALELAGRCFASQKRGAIATVFRSTDPAIAIGARLGLVEDGALEVEATALEAHVHDSIALDLRAAIESGQSRTRAYESSGGMIHVFVEAVQPPPRLVLCGTGPDAVPVAQLAHALGWDVVVYASQPRFSTRERFAMATEIATERDELLAKIASSRRALAIVMTHETARDREQLALLLGTKVETVGVLGTRERAERLVAELGVAGDPRVRAVGLSLFAQTPQEIAMAMLGELVAATATPPVEPVTIVHEQAPPTGSAAAIAAAPAR